MEPPLSIVVVSYNCRVALSDCLRSLRTAGWAATTTVVDNASSDGSADAARQEFPEVQLIANTENRGFAAACNQGFAARPAECVLLLNPDTVIDRPAIERLVAVMRTQPKVGACGPRLIHPDGSLQRSCRRFPGLDTMVLAELGFRQCYQMHDFAHDTTRQVDQLMGACLLVRRAALDPTGLFDERFFLYSEEVDLCWRLKHSGWQVLFVHDAVVTHSGGQSSKTAKDFSLRHRYRSLFEFYRKHFPRWHLVTLKLAVQLAAVFRLLWGQPAYGCIAREVWRL